MTKINYDKFRNALLRLEERYCFYQENQEKNLEIMLIESIKESCIKRFEVCLDTSWKHLKKYLEQEMGKSQLPNSPIPLFKEAFANNIIEDAELWIEFNEKRIGTSHDYSNEKADDTFNIIGDFIREAIDLYETISNQEWKI